MTNAASSGRTSAIAPPGGVLGALSNSDFGYRFYSWRGASGSKYICTIFQPADYVSLAGFVGAAVIGVAHHNGERRLVCVLQPTDFRVPARHRTLHAATKLGVNEWHVHFIANVNEVISDLKMTPLRN